MLSTVTGGKQFLSVLEGFLLSLGTVVSLGEAQVSRGGLTWAGAARSAGPSHGLLNVVRVASRFTAEFSLLSMSLADQHSTRGTAVLGKGKVPAGQWAHLTHP